VTRHRAAPSAVTRRRRIAGWTIAALAFFSIIGLTALLVSPLINASDQVSEIVDPFPEESLRPKVSETTEVRTILILGSDSVKPISKQLADIRGTRSDMIMVARIDPTLGRVDVMSIMRDTWVPVAGFGQAKINAALSYGGVKLAVQTVETLLDARIDHVSVIDLRGLEKLTDALGGITVDNPQAFGSNAGGGIRFDEGPISLTGKEVVVFVRDRYSFEDGDFTRVANQRLVLRGLIMKAFSKEVISSPPRLISAYSSIAPFLATDSGINAGLMLSQAGFFVNFDRENINLFTMPNAGIGRSKDGQSIILVDTEKLQKLKSDWQAGNLDGY